MTNLKFGGFCLGLTAVVGVAVATLGAQDPSARPTGSLRTGPSTSPGAGHVEVRTGQAPARGSLMMLDGRGSQLGVMVSDLEADERAGAKTSGGVKIDEVDETSAAEKAGLKAGDIVIEYDGERVRSARQFTRLVQETPEGRTVRIAVLRNGQKQTVEATPEARAFSWNMDIDGDRIRREVERGLRGRRNFRVEPPLDFDFRFEPGAPRRFEFRLPGDVGSDDMPGMIVSRGRLGVTVSALSPQLADYFGVKEGGVLVSSVARESAAEKAGIKAGDVITSVNGDRVRDPNGLVRELNDSSSAEVAIGIVRDKKESTVKAQIEKPTSTPGNSRPGRRI